MMYNITWVVVVYAIIIITINTITTAFINRHRHISSSSSVSKYHSNNIVINAVKISGSGYDVTPWKSDRVISEAKRLCGDDDIRFNIIINSATEKSYTGKFMNGERYNHKGEGVYVGAIGELPLFWSKHKYVSGTGYPSFFDVFDRDHVIELIDPNLKGYTKLVCARTSIHLGHAFVDHPPPALERQLYSEGIVYEKFQFTRYCCNAASLRFVPMSEFINNKQSP